jgi:hypothetical protein
MFETRGTLAEEIRGLLSALRGLGGGRYACLLEPGGILFEDKDADAPAPWALRRFLEEHSAAVFAIPGTLHSEAPMNDAFAEWEDDGFFLAFVNGRVAVVVACPDPGTLEAQAGRLLKALVDRLIRYNPAWRADERGRGLFFSRPRLDTVVIGQPSR